MWNPCETKAGYTLDDIRICRYEANRSHRVVCAHYMLEVNTKTHRLYAVINPILGSPS